MPSPSRLPWVKGAPPMEIRAENLGYTYNLGTALEMRAIEHVDFVLPRGSVLGILGGTGSGKTTLVKNLNGLLTPTEGRVVLDGRDIAAFGPGLRRKVGLVLQRPERQLFEETVLKDISFVLRRFSSLAETEILERVEAACRLLGLNLEEIGERSPFTLSEGEKRKAAIAGVLVNEPEVLILDEPAVGLDPPSLKDLLSLMETISASRDRTTIIVSHDMEPFLTLLDFMMVLDQGSVAAFGPPAAVCASLETEPSLRDYLPPLALLIQDLRRAGFELQADRYRVEDLADQLARCAQGSEDCS